MIKMTIFLKRNPALSREEFVRHHVERHGPLFRSVPEVGDHVVRYIQTHPTPATTATAAFDFENYDGTAEIWFKDIAGLEAVFGSRSYKERVVPDEKEFLDLEHTLSVLGEVEIIV